MSEQCTRITGDVDAMVHPQVGLWAVRESVRRLIWGTMWYECDKCGFGWEIGMTMGVEGPPTMRNAGLYLASPFTAGKCPAWPDMQSCDGEMFHKAQAGRDREFDEPFLASDETPLWVLPEMVWRADGGARLEISEPALIAARRGGA